jgi:hypothetical protein
MKAKRAYLPIITCLLTVMACQEKRQFPKEHKLSSLNNTEFVATLENKIDSKKNNIYAASLLFAWDEIRRELDAEILVDPKYRDFALFNQCESYQKALNSDEYTSSTEVIGDTICARATFSISLPFPEKLKSYKDNLTFGNTNVASFGARGSDRFKFQIIKILYYKDDNNFVIGLNPTDKQHQILLFNSTKKFKTLGESNAEIQRLILIGKEHKKEQKTFWRGYFEDEDVLIIPKFSFNISTHIPTLEGIPFKSGTRSYMVDEAWQRTAFILDEVGAEVESEALMSSTEAYEEEKPKPKKLIFNQPFTVLLKKVNSDNPYFGMWVADAKLMIKE